MGHGEGDEPLDVGDLYVDVIVRENRGVKYEWVG